MVKIKHAPENITEIGPIHDFVLDEESVGLKSFRMGMHVLPPGKRTMPHYHDVESAVYMVKGGAVVFVGKEQNPVRLLEGDFLYIPALEIHSAFNPTRKTHVSIIIQAGPTDKLVGTYELPELKPKGLRQLKALAARPKAHKQR